jgi:ryanodine receptor 3
LSQVFSWCFSGNNRTAAPVTLPIEEILQTLRDLIAYFQPPEEEMRHEDKQNKLRSLKNRQNLFKEEVSQRGGDEVVSTSWAQMSS